MKVFVEQLDTARPRAYGEKYPEISAAVQEKIHAAVSALTGDDVDQSKTQATIKTARGKRRKTRCSPP